MTTIDGGTGRKRFGFGDAFAATFDAVGANFVSMFTTAVVLVGLPNFLVQLATMLVVGSASTSNPSAVFSGPALIFVLIGTIVSMVTTVLMQGALTRMVVIHHNGGRPRVLDCLRATVGLILPLIGIAIVSGIGIGLGFIVLIVPGLFLWIAWSLAGPVEVVERRGVFGSIARSFSLTENYRWMIFLVIIVLAILFMIVGAVIGGVSAVLTLSLGAGSIAGGAVRAVFTAAVACLSGVFGASAVASLYSGIRQVKEGATPQSLAAVFD